jgi:spore coat protein H
MIRTRLIGLLVLGVAALPLMGGLTACTGAVSEATDADGDTAARPEGWSEDSHSGDADPNYEVAFPQDRVNQITITIAPEDWEAMQANMTELFGEAGSGEGGRGFPGGFEAPEGGRARPGEEGFPEGFEPPEGGWPRPGDEGIPEGFERPEGGWPRPGEGGLPEGFEPPAEGDRAAPRDGVPFEGRPGGGGIRGGDMTPENPMWVPATVEFQGKTWTHVGVRYKGNSSLTSGWRSGGLKLPLKLDFDEFEDDYPEIDDQRFYGFKQLSLASGFMDASFMRDAATADILEEAGLPAAETAFYEVVLDYGEGPVVLGLYTVIEVIDDTVVPRYFGEDDGNIYEAEGSAATLAASTRDQIEESFQKENNQDAADWSDIQALFDALHSDQRTIDPAAWRAELESVLDVDGFLEWLAISAVIQHWDAYGAMSHNYYLYHDPETGQLKWISWDHNQAMSAGMGGGRGMGGRGVSLDKADIDDNWPLIRFLLDDPVYYERYLDYLAETVAGPFNPDHMAEKYEAWAELIRSYAAADVGEEAFDSAVEALIDHAYGRADAVRAFLSSVGR